MDNTAPVSNAGVVVFSSLGTPLGQAFTDTTGDALPGSVNILESPHGLMSVRVCTSVLSSRVIPARLRGVNVKTGGVFEMLLLEENATNDWWAMLKPGKRAVPGFVPPQPDFCGDYFRKVTPSHTARHTPRCRRHYPQRGELDVAPRPRAVA